MRKSRLVLICIFVFALAVPLTASASRTIERIKLREKGVAADWAYTDEAGTTTVVSVVASEFSSKPNGSEAPTPFLALSIIQYDSEGIPLILGTGETDQFDLTVQGNLSTGHLSATVPVTDGITGNINEPATIDLTWTATGPLIKTKHKSRVYENGVIIISRLKGKEREAQATGSVVLFGTEFASGPSTLASIHDVKDGTITIMIE